ncbi:MAG: ABC transporter ATP-binding protein/permease [Clostridiales bacterium]|nr:ABC transporter ATP-binding protein/permease [Clostridiales bacterium]
MIFGKHVNRYYFRNAGFLLLGVLALVLVDYFQLKIPELYRMVINGMNTGYVDAGGGQVAFDLDFLLDEICLPMIFITLAMVLGRFLWRVCFFGSAVRVETDLRNRMFDHCKDLSQEYYQVNKVGNLMSLFTNDLETIQECFGDGVLMFFDALLLGVLAIYKMWRMNVVLTCLSMIPMALLLVIGTIVGKTMVARWEVRQQAFSDLSDFSQEAFSGIAVVKAFVKELKELLAFQKLNQQNEDTNVDYTRVSTLLQILVTLLTESVVCVILGYGGYLAYCGRFDAGQLVEFIGYFTSVVWPIMAVAMLIEKSSRGQASLKRISQLLDTRQDVVDRPDVTPVDTLRGDIAFRNLTFTYPGGEYPALRDVSFTIQAGESVGIVGKTGAGKTTLVDLILRSYNVPDGAIFLDGKDVNTIPIRDVRAACAYVPQDNFLFSDTIARNIAFSQDEVDPELVAQAAKLAGVHEDITDFPGGYQTVLGERGVTVSGGQKQRISIARALLKEAPILILDDSVSAVDTQTEQEILEHLHTSRAGRTTILIAHRISTVEKLDKLILLEDGAVLAVGSHEELYARCAAYRKMVDLQRLEEEGGADHA